MRFCLSALVPFVACSALSGQPPVPPPPKVQIFAPSWGEGVNGPDWVEGFTNLKKEGWAVVFLKSGKDAAWEVKASVRTTPTGEFKAAVPLSGTGTTAGTEMKLAVLAFASAPNPKAYKVGAQFDALPKAAAASDEVPLVVVKDEERGKIALAPPKDGNGEKKWAASFEFPVPGQPVVRHEDVEAKVNQKGFLMILVRAERERAPTGEPVEPYWWVQPYPTNPRAKKPFEVDDVIRSKVFFGDSETKAGAAFRVLVLVSKDDLSKQFPERTKLRYPPSLPGSVTLKVIRQ